MINISAEDTKLFEQNGFTKEKVGATVQHYREQGLSDEEIQSKLDARINEFRGQTPSLNPSPSERESKGIDLTPSGLVKQGLAATIAPIRGAIHNEDYKTARQNALKAAENFKPAGGAGDFLVDMAAYSQLPVLRGGGLGNFIGNAAIQGGVPGALEGLKEGENPLKSAGTGTGIAAGINTILAGIPRAGNLVRGVIDNPEVQNKVTKGLEALTSVPQEYSQRALDAELAGNSLFKGKFDAKTAYRPIEERLRTAKSLLPSAESYADEFYKLGQRAKTGIENIKESSGQEISDMLGKLKAEPIQINGLKNSIDSLVKNYARGGDINPAEIRAGRDLDLVRDMLGMKNGEQTKKEILDYVNNNKFGVNANNKALNKEAENIAFDILAQATGKNKKWLQSQLNANVPKLSTQKRQEFIENLLEHTDDKISNIDPSWRQYFPEFNWENLQEGGADTSELTRNLLSRILRRDINKTTELASPAEQAIEEMSNKYNNLLGKVAANPNKQAINQSYNELQDILSYTPENIKDDLVTKYANDIENLQNIANPSVKPIDLHNAKEILYDMANYDTTGGTRNDVLKSVANQINNFIRTKYPQYKAPNDKFAMIKTLENNLGGINSSTIANKLSNYGSANNIASGLDQRLRDINNILPQESRFIDQTKNLVNSQNEVNNINRLIGAAYEKNPRLLSNINDTAREEALENLQKMTGVNFMDDLNNIRAREALENLFPGQGGGSGSSQGFGNLLRTAIIGGAPTASAITGNPTALLGLAAISPKIMAQGTIKNLGRIYRNLGQQVPEAVQRLLNPLAVKMASPMLYGGISNTEDY